MRAQHPATGTEHRLTNRSRVAIVLIETVAMLAAMLGPAVAEVVSVHTGHNHVLEFQSCHGAGEVLFGKLLRLQVATQLKQAAGAI